MKNKIEVRLERWKNVVIMQVLHMDETLIEEGLLFAKGSFEIETGGMTALWRERVIISKAGNAATKTFSTENDARIYMENVKYLIDSFNDHVEVKVFKSVLVASKKICNGDYEVLMHNPVVEGAKHLFIQISTHNDVLFELNFSSTEDSNKVKIQKTFNSICKTNNIPFRMELGGGCE